MRSVTATLTTAVAPPQTIKQGPGPARKRMRSFYPAWFFIPAIALYVVFFAVPTFAGFYFSLTRWTLFDQTFIGFDKLRPVLPGPAARLRFVHTSSTVRDERGEGGPRTRPRPAPHEPGARARLPPAVVFFPVLVSTIGIGITFKALMDPFTGSSTAHSARSACPPRAG